MAEAPPIKIKNMDDYPNLHKVVAKEFVKHCIVQFGWKDLSRDVIMDIGCGAEWNCSKELIEKFPAVGTIIGVDKNCEVKGNFKPETETKVEFRVEDIENWMILPEYAGKMDIVISTYTLHRVRNFVFVFRNLFALLKPKGHAAVLFNVKSPAHDWLTEVFKDTNWKNAFKGTYVNDDYQEGHSGDYYEKIALDAGFQVKEKKEEERVFPFESDQVCKEELYKMYEHDFPMAPGRRLDQFKEESFQIFLQLSGRDDEGRPCYRSTEFYLLLEKPRTRTGSKTKE